MSELIYLQLALPANKVYGYTISYGPGRLPPFRYEIRLSGSLTYMKDNFDRWVYLTDCAHGCGETISQAVDKALLHLDELFKLALIRANESQPKPISGLSSKAEISELSNLLGL